jgi:maltooligosyltrehalose trehalohydrolase
MNEFRVWAPEARMMRLRFGADPASMQSYPMSQQRSGWWRVAVVNASKTAEYAFEIDGEKPLPDPRSLWQPHGVHGASRLYDHSLFSWTDRSWQAPPLSSAVIYELHIGTFTPEGTFDSAIARLDHLTGLGVTHVELMPVAEFPGSRGWGYDGVDLFAPHHAYGGPDGLKRLVDACHQRGLAVLLDVVYNHLGPDGNYLGRFGPYFTQKYSTPWGSAINLDDAGSSEVRRFFCDNALMWLRDYHFDGLRLDAIHAIFDSSAMHFLEQLASEVRALEAETGRHLVVIAESDLNDPKVVTPREAGGYGVDAQWSDDFHHALHTVLTGEQAGYYADFGTLAHLAKALKAVFVNDGCYSGYRRRNHGRAPCGLSGCRFLGFLQNHDQVGNRARGDRSSQIMNLRKLKIGAALVLCSPFIPLLFQGEEFGASTPFLYFTDHQDPELGRAVSKGRREEFAAFGWKIEDIPDPQNPETFRRSRLDWSELERAPHTDLLDWYRRLIALRRSTPALNDGSLERIEVNFDEIHRWFVLNRGPIAVISNLANSRQTIPIPHPVTLVLSSEADVGMETSGEQSSIEMPPESIAIFAAAYDMTGPAEASR